jgi:putative transposase
MPGRKIPLVTNYFYHVYNRGVEGRPTYTSTLEYRRFLNLLNYYRFEKLPTSYSNYKNYPKENKIRIMNELKNQQKTQVEIINYCLMPNHFHLLLNQTAENGISNFMSKLQNGYTKYFNKRNNRYGSLFQGRFKSIIIESENQLLHVFRYIILNPYSVAVVKNIEKLVDYPWIPLKEYLQNFKKEKLLNRELILNLFTGVSSFKDFIFDYADYQKKLEVIKHLTLEKSTLTSQGSNLNNLQG